MFSDAQVHRLLDIATAACHSGNVVDARTICQGVLAERPKFVPALITLALSHVVVSEFEEAERMLKEDILAQSPEDPEASATLGLCYLLMNRKDEARDILLPLSEGDSSAAKLAAQLVEQAL